MSCPLFNSIHGDLNVVTIEFNAFSFLQKKLKEMNRSYSNVKINVPQGHTVRELIADMGLDTKEVEGVFINGKIHHIDSALGDGDRVAIFPPGTPGPYRLLLGILKKRNSSK